MKKTYLIIGASAAGISAVNKIRQLDPDATIVCISDEAEFPYNKCFLADYLAGSKTQEQLAIFTPELVRQKNVQLLLGKKVSQLHCAEKQIELTDGQRISYDVLLIATGTSPIKPNIPGIDAQGVFNFHGLGHATSLLQFVKQLTVRGESFDPAFAKASAGEAGWAFTPELSRGVRTGGIEPGPQLELQRKLGKTIIPYKTLNAVIIGAGLSGLECADALTAQGVKVTVVERAEQILPRLVDTQGAAFIENAMRNLGVVCLTQHMVTEIIIKEQRVAGVTLANGTVIPADVVVCALGARPNTAFTAEAGIKMQDAWIQVDVFMQTSIPGIFAAGDVVVVKDQISGNLVPSCTWSDAMHQGLIAAHNMVGQPRAHPGVTVITSSAFFGVKFASCGPISNQHELEVAHKTTESEYKMLLTKDAVLKGFLIIAPALSLGNYRKAVLTGQKIVPEELIGL